MKLGRALLPAVILCLQAAAQNIAWDSSGNSMLSGSYYFREVIYFVGDNFGNLDQAIAVYGGISFSGTGTYTISAVAFDSNFGVPQGFSKSGTYSISASGYGFISNPLSDGDAIFGSVSNGVFIGSSTESGINDLFVAAKLPTQGSLGSLRGSYTLSYMDLSGGSPAYAYDALWQMSPDGAGNLGTVSLKAYLGSNGSSAISQNITGVRYIYSNGAVNMQFPNSQTNIIAGNEYLYFSPDGNFVFGGSPNGWDFFVGVHTPASTGSTGLNGLYYQAGLEMDTSTLLSQQYGTLSTYYGALTAGGGSIIGHQRLYSGFATDALDYTYSAKYAVNPDGTYTDSNASIQYLVGSGSGIRIGLGIGPYLGIHVALPVTPFSGDGVYLNPTGVINAASSAPFTAGIAPGELITLYGSNLAPSTVIAPSVPFPTTLAGVQVKINGTAAPIYYVSPTQASVVVPYGMSGGIAQIQATNNGENSNAITLYTDVTAPGIFTNPVGGIGSAAALHQDGSLVSTTKPAQSGEYIAVFVTGLGLVSPSITDGDVGPSDPLSKATANIVVTIGGKTANVPYAGLAPQLAGLYQINVQIPTGLTAGDVPITIAGPDSYTSEATIAVTP